MLKLIFIFLFSSLFPGNVYVALQMLDKVGVVDSETLQLIEYIDTDFNEMSSDSCMDYASEMDCSMADGCEWMMGMCMESGGGFKVCD